VTLDDALREQVRSALRDELPGALAEALERAKAPAPTLATREACSRYLGITVRSLDTLRADGLPTVWVLSSPRFDLGEVMAWLRTRGQP
jgi:hypothetical protein